MIAPEFGRFQLVIFDWAGTMVDFGSRAPVEAMIAAFAQEGVPIDETQARADMGKAKVDHVRGILSQPTVADAWRVAHGAAAGETDIHRMMTALGPLMRDAAEAASELVPGALDTVRALRAAGVKVASSTGYTREMMAPVLWRAAEQGYAPDHVVCAGETPQGRPSPLMIYKTCAELGVWPLSDVVKVDDAEAGVAEGRAAGCFTVGLAASGNCLGLSREALEALAPADRSARLVSARARLLAAGADLVVDTVAALPDALRTAAASAA